jgi:hypothetical protein
LEKDQMKKLRLLRSIASVAVVAAVASGAVVMGFAASASASGNPPWEPVTNPPEVGSLLFFNAAGQQITGGNLTDAPLAAYVQGTATIVAGNTKATLFGYTPVNGVSPGAWSGEQLSGVATTYPNPSAPGALGTSSLPLETGASGDENLATYIGDFPNTDTSTDGYAGLYVLRLKTSASGSGISSSYDSADISVNTTAGTWSVVYPAPTVTATSTALATSPASPQVSGTSVTLTATVSPSAPGTVQFEYGTTDVGSPVSVSGGTASISTTSLPVGTDALSAVFTPAAFSAYSGSTGTASYTISPAPAAGTTTALGVNPTTEAADTAVALTGAVTITSSGSPLASGAGSVNFYDNGTSTSDTITSSSQLLQTVSLGTGGVASLSWSSFAVGAHNIVAVFTPSTANTGVYNSSTSLVVLDTATAPTYAPDPQTVTVGIPAGTLVISTPYDPASPFSLGTASLNAGDLEFTSSAAFGTTGDPGAGVTITDTRAGDLPWTASAEATNFTDSTSDVINGQNLGFTGLTAVYIAGNALQSPDVTTTNVPNSGTPVGPTGTGTTGDQGLGGEAHEFASAAAGAGSVYIIGSLNLIAPTSTPAGTYTATLTFTIT